MTEDALLNWAVRLPGSDSFINLQELNNPNFTDDPQRNLTVANTPLSVRSPRNGSTVRCRMIHSGISTKVIETTLIVYGKSAS